jgi:hypothetical protein
MCVSFKNILYKKLIVIVLLMIIQINGYTQSNIKDSTFLNKTDTTELDTVSILKAFLHQNKNKRILQEILNADPSEYVKGTIYKVQIGNYGKFLIDNFTTNKTLSLEIEDNNSRYIISKFKTKKEATEFKESMKKLGITDAFVTKYVNGLRVKD